MCCSQLCLPWHHLHRAGGTLTARQGRSLAPSYPWLASEALLAAEEQQQESGFPDPIHWAEGECWLRCAYVLQDQHRVRCGPWPGAVRAGFPVSVVDELEAMSAYTGKSDKPRSSKFIQLKCVKLLLSMVHCSSSDDSQVSLSWCAMFHWRKRRDLSKFTNNNNPSPNFVFKIPLFLFYSLSVYFSVLCIDTTDSYSEDRNEPIHHIVSISCPKQRFLIFYLFQINRLIYTFITFLIHLLFLCYGLNVMLPQKSTN